MTARTLLKYLFLTGSLLVAGQVMWYLSQKTGLEGSGATTSPVSSRTDNLQVTGIHLEQFDGERRLWVLQAPGAEHGHDERTLVQLPYLEVFRQEGDVIRVKSKQGILDDQTRAILFQQEVSVDNDQGDRLTAGWMKYDPVTRLLFTDAAFHMEHNQMTLAGIGLRIHQDSRRLQVLQQVKAVFSY